MAMNTWAAIEYGKVDTIGLCHGVQHGGEQIAAVLGAKDTSELEFICSGINHQTWYIDIRFRGRKIEKDELVAAFERHPVYSQQEKVRIDVLKRFGFYSTELNGHLSEYLPWYRKRPEEISRWIDMSDWIHGETGGYLRHSHRNAQLVRDRLPAAPRGGGPADRPGQALDRARQLHHRGDRDRPDAIAATSTSRTSGLITNLPADAIVESPGFVDRFGLNMVAGITLPEACAATCIASINVQRMSVHAAITGDVELLKLAVLHDPLVGAICSPDEVWQMVDEMLVAQAEWLPQYAACHPGRQGAPRPQDRGDDATGRARRDAKSRPHRGRARGTATQKEVARTGARAGRRNESSMARRTTRAPICRGSTAGNEPKSGRSSLTTIAPGAVARCGSNQGGTVAKTSKALGGASLLVSVSAIAAAQCAEPTAARSAEVRRRSRRRTSSASATSSSTRRCRNITSRTG